MLFYAEKALMFTVIISYPKMVIKRTEFKKKVLWISNIGWHDISRAMLSPMQVISFAGESILVFIEDLINSSEWMCSLAVHGINSSEIWLCVEVVKGRNTGDLINIWCDINHFVCLLIWKLIHCWNTDMDELWHAALNWKL